MQGEDVVKGSLRICAASHSAGRLNRRAEPRLTVEVVLVDQKHRGCCILPSLVLTAEGRTASRACFWAILALGAVCLLVWQRDGLSSGDQIRGMQRLRFLLVLSVVEVVEHPAARGCQQPSGRWRKVRDILFCEVGVDFECAAQATVADLSSCCQHLLAAKHSAPNSPSAHRSTRSPSDSRRSLWPPCRCSCLVTIQFTTSALTRRTTRSRVKCFLAPPLSFPLNFTSSAFCLEHPKT